MIRRIIFSLLMLLSGSLISSDACVAGDTEPVVLTVTGNIANPNRGPVDEFDDAVFAHLEVKFNSAYTFTLADLRALPQRTVKAKYEGWPREVTATGPSLSDVLKAAGATGKKIIVQAVDGYAPEFTAEDLAQDKLILALEADGKPLPLGGRGPIWLLRPNEISEDPQTDENLAFAVIHIDVQSY